MLNILFCQRLRVDVVEIEKLAFGHHKMTYKQGIL